MNLIVAVDKKWGIGKSNKILYNIKPDMEFFKEKTLNSTVIMGRKTLESLPKGKPLKDRTNIVLTENPLYVSEGVITVESVKEAIACAVFLSKDVYVIGGSSIYQQFLPYCKTAYVTKIDDILEADAFCPNLDELKEWEIQEESKEYVYNNYSYKFVKYIRVDKK